MNEVATSVVDYETDYKTVQIGLQEVQFPVDWDIKTVTELFDIQKDSFDPSEVPEETELQLYSMPAFDDGREPENTKAGDVGSKKYRVPENTILFPKLNIFLKRFWRVTHSHNIPAICSTEYWPLVKKEDLNLDFYYHYFNSHSFMSNPKVSLASGTDSHRRVKQGSFERTQLPVPPRPEQDYIADVLSTVDKEINQTNKILEQLDTLKSGLMQDLLIRGIGHDKHKQIRLGPKKIEIPNNWQKSNLDEVCDIITRGKQPTYVDQGGVPVLNQSCIYWDGFRPEEVKRLDEEVANDWKEKYWVKKGDILINSTGKGTLGRALEWTGNSNKYALDSHITRVHPDDERLDPTYLRYYLESQHGQSMLHAFCVAGSTGQTELSKTDLQTMPILLPPIEEQHAISEAFHKIRKKTQEEQDTKKKLKELKSGLMQDLLNGDTRINPRRSD